MLGVLLLTSKGAAAVTGSGFVTLAATLAAFPTIPVAGLTLLLGVDRFMSEARAITNLIGNAVATMVGRAVGRRARSARVRGAYWTATPADTADRRDRDRDLRRNRDEREWLLRS